MSHDLSPPTILFVDDETNMILTLANNIMRSLAHSNARIQVATDTEQAVEVIRNTKFLIAAFVDLWMRDKKTGAEDHNAGRAVIQEIKKKHPKCQIIVFSAHIDGGIEEALRQYKVIVMKKPCSTGELIEVLQPALDQL